MNLNNFVVFPNKPKSVKLKARNLLKLHIESSQISQGNKDIDSRLQQLREVMSHQKEDREKNGALQWKSAQTKDWTRDKEKQLDKSFPSKIKIRMLNNELLPVERVPEPPPPRDVQSKKSRLKGKACGQCEARTAGIVCAECAEDYCAGCFSKFHQKGALRFHHIIPTQAELHTSISTLDVVNHFQKKTESEKQQEIHLNNSAPEQGASSTLLQPVSDNRMHNTQVLCVNDAEEVGDEENEGPLLRGNFDEEESSNSFQQALNAWRAGNTHGDREHHGPNHIVQTTQPVSMEVMGTQAGEETHIRVEFKDHGLSYMERLLLKKHRRTHIESYQLLSAPRSPQDLITDPRTQPETCELTAEEMDLHHYCVSLFAISGSAEAEEVNNIFKLCLSITEIDETAGDPPVDSSFGVKQRGDKIVNQGGDNLAVPSQTEEIVLHSGKALDFSQETKTLANKTILSGSEESFLQSPPSEQLTFHKLQKSSDVLTSTGSEMLITEQYKEYALQESPKLPKPQISGYPLQTKSTPKSTKTLWDSRSSTPLASQSHSPFISTSIKGQSPFSSQSKPAVDTSLSLSLQSHSPQLSSSTVPVSFMPKLSPNSSEDQCTIVYAKVPSPPSFRPIEEQNNKEMLSHVLQSPRHADSIKPQTPISSLEVTSTQSIESSLFPQSHGSLSTTSVQCLSPAFTESFSQTKSGNTPTQSKLPSEDQKSAEQSSSDDEEPYFLALGSLSSLARSEILQISPPLYLSSSNSDMSSDTFGMMPTDEDSSDEELNTFALKDIAAEEDRNIKNMLSFSPSLFPIAGTSSLSQSVTNEEQSGFFTKPSQAVSSLAQRHNSVSTNYQGLDGFFTLGLDSRSVPLSPAPLHAPSVMHNQSTNSEAFMSGESVWRPESSLQHHAETKLVGVVINNLGNGITSQSVTPVSKMAPSRRPSQSGASVPITQSASHPSCASRPLSRAALEILEVQSVEQPTVTEIKQDEEDLLTITSLEEEFKLMSSEPNFYVPHKHEDM